MSVSKITKSPGVGSIEAPGVSLATLTYGGPQDTASATEAFVIAPGMMEMPNNPFTVALDGQVPDTGTVTWLLNDVVQQTLPYDAAYTPTMMGKITAEFVLGGEAYVTVPLHIYMHDMSDPAMSPSHMVDENAALGLVRQNVADFVAVQNGSWSDPATWSVGAVPGDGARVLIPSTRDVLYDSNTPVRLHSVRVDGLLDFALDRSTSMLVEHLVETKTGTIRIAAKANRLPPQFTCQVTISNRVFDSAPDAPSDLDFANDPRLIGRGVIWMGGGAIYGYHRAPFAKTVALNLPMMGDTSVTLGADPEGWQVGDRILIPGTLFEEINGVTQRQDETRIITAISGGVISFAEPLVYDHGWHNPALAEQNIWRLKIVNMERNVTFRSEDGANLPAHQRGHTMVMHTNQTRHWDVAFLDMGRTDKSFVTGVINANGDFEYPDPDSNAILTAPLTAQSNLQSRYPYHIHFPGFGKSVVAEAYYVYVEGVPGWGIVHHGGRANFVGCVAHRFLGAGMVSESANELGRWHDCVMVGCESTIADTLFPKGAEDKRGIQGDFAFSGYGFFYRGRDMVVTDCTAYGCTWAHVFYHRFFQTAVSLPIDPLRVNVDSHTMGWIFYEDEITFVDRPITHFDGCEAAGCAGGVAVVKAGPEQQHDLNIQIANVVCWSVYRGVGVNYVGAYQINNVDVASYDTATGPASEGLNVGIGTGKSVQVAVYDVTTRGFASGLLLSGRAVGNAVNSSFSQEAPRFMVKNHISVGDAQAIEYEGVSGTPETSAEPVTWFAPGGHTDLDYPDLLGPLVIADWDSSNSFTNVQQPFVKIDSVNANTSSTDSVLPKSWDLAGLINVDKGQETRAPLANLITNMGYYTYNGEPHIHFPLDVSDQLTARSILQSRLIRCTFDTSSFTNLGTLVQSATEITASDFTVEVAQNSTVSFNAITSSGATGEAGATLTLGDPHITAYVNTSDALVDPTPYEPAHFKPNRGDITIAQNGDISYTALPHDAATTDKMRVYIYDGRLRWKTVTITFNITLP